MLKHAICTLSYLLVSLPGFPTSGAGKPSIAGKYCQCPYGDQLHHKTYVPSITFGFLRLDLNLYFGGSHL